MAGLLFLHGCRRLAARYQEDTREDQQDGERFQPAELVHAPQDGHGGSDDRLAVVVHAHCGGLETLLCEGEADIADEGGQHDHIGDARPRLEGQAGVGNGGDFPESEGQARAYGVCEHPFHQRDRGVFADQPFEEHEVNGHTALGCQAEDVPQQVVVSWCGRSVAAPGK